MKKIRLMSLLTLFLLLGASFVACNNVKDSDLETKANEIIATNPDAANVTVMVLDKVATLSGSVAEESTKTFVESSTKGVKGVKSVVNNIMVVPPAPDYTELDNSLSAAMPDLLKDHPTVTADVKDGVVTLNGEILTKDLPKLMEKVSALDPISIQNNIIVK